MSVQIKAIAIHQGSRTLHVKGMSLVLRCSSPNNTLPLVTPSGTSSQAAGINQGLYMGQRGVK